MSGTPAYVQFELESWYREGLCSPEDVTEETLGLLRYFPQYLIGRVKDSLKKKLKESNISGGKERAKLLLEIVNYLFHSVVDEFQSKYSSKQPQDYGYSPSGGQHPSAANPPKQAPMGGGSGGGGGAGDEAPPPSQHQFYSQQPPYYSSVPPQAVPYGYAKAGYEVPPASGPGGSVYAPPIRSRSPEDIRPKRQPAEGTLTREEYMRMAAEAVRKPDPREVSPYDAPPLTMSKYAPTSLGHPVDGRDLRRFDPDIPIERRLPPEAVAYERGYAPPREYLYDPPFDPRYDRDIRPPPYDADPRLPAHPSDRLPRDPIMEREVMYAAPPPLPGRERSYSAHPESGFYSREMYERDRYYESELSSGVRREDYETFDRSAPPLLPADELRMGPHDISGPPVIMAELEALYQEGLCRPRDIDQLARARLYQLEDKEALEVIERFRKFGAGCRNVSAFFMRTIKFVRGDMKPGFERYDRYDGGRGGRGRSYDRDRRTGRYRGHSRERRFVLSAELRDDVRKLLVGGVIPDRDFEEYIVKKLESMPEEYSQKCVALMKDPIPEGKSRREHLRRIVKDQLARYEEGERRSERDHGERESRHGGSSNASETGITPQRKRDRDSEEYDESDRSFKRRRPE